MQQLVIRSMMTSGAGAVLLAGCAPLPPLRTDIPATPEAFRNAAATPPAPAGAAFTGPWWAIFGDPVLDDLITRAEARNDSIAIAVADLDRARAVAGIARADQSPQLGAGASVTRGDGIGPRQSLTTGAAISRVMKVSPPGTGPTIPASRPTLSR